MGDTPHTENPELKATDEVIHAGVYDVGVNAALSEIYAQVPALALPVISFAVKWLVNRFAGLLYKQLTDLAAFAIIDAQTGHEQTQYQKAVDALLAAQQKKDPHAIEKAKADFRSTLGKLIHFDGS